MKTRTILWLLVTLAALAVLPWYAAPDGGPVAITGAWPAGPYGSALGLGLTGGRYWLLPCLLALVLAAVPLLKPMRNEDAGAWIIAGAGLGLVFLLAQGFAIGLQGWSADWLTGIFGAPGPKQIGMGLGAGVTFTGLLMLLSLGLASRGWCRGDVFVVASIAWVVALIGFFVFFPVSKILASAFVDNAGHLAPGGFIDKITDASIWGLGCLGGRVQCGVAWNTIFLAIAVGLASTLLGLAFALIAARTDFRFKGLLRLLTLLPIITPPFVIGLALILMFGRSGAVSTFLFSTLGIAPSRWIYGFTGVFIAQCLAFAPIAFLVVLGVVQGISPALEEAAQTLRGSRWTIFRTITWPLMRPGLANAFLLGFIESMADFGNPLVLGGNFEVLSTRIFFAVVGAATDQARAAILSIVLLAFTLAGFWLQQAWVGKKAYVTVTGKGDSGLPLPLPRRVAALSYATALPWGLFTLVIYGLILVSGFVKTVGRDYTPTLEHYITGFRIEQSGHGLFFSGSAWNSFFATAEVSLIAAPLTAAIGILTAWLLTRQRFAGQGLFEFGTMLSFAIPGTVVGVSYILAFNVPPVEITGTAMILVICFVFRNMPVGVRSGMATLSQIDKSLDEASLTLGARSFTTMWRVVLPLLRPTIVASLVYSFVRAMTAVSAVIFLVSAEYNMATTYIIGRVEAGEAGLAIAYSSVLIIFMLVVIVSIEKLIGERRLGRRTSIGPIAIQAG